MIQDIFPHTFDNSFRLEKPQSDSVVFCCKGNKALLKEDGTVPVYSELELKKEPKYLFQIDGKACFGTDEVPENLKLKEYAQLQFRHLKAPWGLGVFTAQHLMTWYRNNRYCGCCGNKMKDGNKERKVVCETCGKEVYPRINPVVITAIVDGDRLLMTRYANGPVGWFALVAGFVEIGESAEDAVKREVMEEVGLPVKNIQAFKSQPWGCSGNLTLGYWCQLDGENDIPHVDENELAEAKWFRREEIPVPNDTASVTAELIRTFAEGRENYIQE